MSQVQKKLTRSGHTKNKLARSGHTQDINEKGKKRGERVCVREGKREREGERGRERSIVCVSDNQRR